MSRLAVHFCLATPRLAVDSGGASEIHARPVYRECDIEIVSARLSTRDPIAPVGWSGLLPIQPC
jgi:hypothetical protein